MFYYWENCENSLVMVTSAITLTNIGYMYIKVQTSFNVQDNVYDLLSFIIGRYRVTSNPCFTIGFRFFVDESTNKVLKYNTMFMALIIERQRKLNGYI